VVAVAVAVAARIALQTAARRRKEASVFLDACLLSARTSVVRAHLLQLAAQNILEQSQLIRRKVL